MASTFPRASRATCSVTDSGSMGTPPRYGGNHLERELHFRKELPPARRSGGKNDCFHSLLRSVPLLPAGSPSRFVFSAGMEAPPARERGTGGSRAPAWPGSRVSVRGGKGDALPMSSSPGPAGTRRVSGEIAVCQGIKKGEIGSCSFAFLHADLHSMIRAGAVNHPLERGHCLLSVGSALQGPGRSQRGGRRPSMPAGHSHSARDAAAPPLPGAR